MFKNFFFKSNFVLFTVVFEAAIASGAASSIAIDDISFTDGCKFNEQGTHGDLPTPPPPPSGNCPDGLYACLGYGSTSCYGPEQRCDFINACGDQTSNGSPSDEATCGEF